MSASHTVAAALAYPGQKVRCILSCHDLLKSPANCPARIVAKLRRKCPSRSRDFVRPFTSTSTSSSSGLPVYRKHGSRQLRQNWADGRLSRDVVCHAAAAPPGDGFQGGGFTAQPCGTSESSLAREGNPDLMDAPPHGKDSSDSVTLKKLAAWPNGPATLLHHEKDSNSATHVGFSDSTNLQSYLAGGHGPAVAKHVSETRQEETEEMWIVASSNTDLVNGSASLLGSKGDSGTVSRLLAENDGLDHHEAGNTQVAELSSTASPDPVKISLRMITAEDVNDSKIAAGSANIVDEQAEILSSIPVPHQLAVTLNRPKTAEPGAGSGASATDVGKKASSPAMEKEALKDWSAALAAAFKTKKSKQARNDQAGFLPETQFEQVELKTAPDDRDEGAVYSGVVHIAKNLMNKHILITGGTGFLAKVLVEKILRTQPGVGQLYLTVLSGRKGSLEERMAKDVFSTNLFKPLRQQYGDEGFLDFVVRKVTPVHGDISKPDLDLHPTDAQMLIRNVDVIINSAATTTFDERYDTAIQVNTLGPLRLLKFAKKCARLSLYQQISTAYVNGKRKGVSLEMPFEYGQSLVREISQRGPRQEAAQLDPEMEARLAFEVWEDLNRKYPPDGRGKPHTQAVKEIVKLGMQRADMFGWQDTYVFTKAMGEQMVVKHKGDVPVVIIRPSVVESTYRLPFDGWMEGTRMLDPIALAYGRGQMKGFLVNPETILDVIPADIVVNIILAAMAKHGGHKERNPIIYQVASSASNPLTMRKIADVLLDHFKNYPMVSKRDLKKPLEPVKEIHVNYMVFLTSELVFNIFLFLNIKLPLLVLDLPRLKEDSRYAKQRIALKLQLESIANLAKVYKPYVFYEGRFDATNSEKLLAQISSEEQEQFGYSVKDVDWFNYLNKTHFPGLRQHVLKWVQTDTIDPDWTIIDPLPKRGLPSTKRRRPSPSRGLFQLPIRKYNDDIHESQRV